MTTFRFDGVFHGAIEKDLSTPIELLFVIRKIYSVTVLLPTLPGPW